MNATENTVKVCPECFGEKKIETLPGIFENCPECTPNSRIRNTCLHIPPDIKKNFRLWCLDKGLSMTDAIIALIRYTLNNDPDLTKEKK